MADRLTLEKYGCLWNPVTDPAIIEMTMIRHGGQWTKKDGRLAGNGLFYHYRALQSLLWPEDDHHRWSDLMLRNFLENTITAVLGPKDSSKTHTMTKFGLTDYFVFPNDTLIMISSTDLRGLEYRVWGDLKNMFQKAKDRYSWLPGFLIDSKHAICTQNIKEDDVRDMRKGIVTIPCLSSSGQFVGLGKYVGIKQKRRRLLGDECSLMRSSYLDSLANLNSGDFKGIFVGNPIGENDPLDKISEPKDGWDSIGIPMKTTIWENRFANGKTVNLVGIDSPNFDFPQEPKPRYEYLINQKEIDKVVKFYQKDSMQYFSQCLGVRRSGIEGHRVITRQLCEQFDAFKDAVWYDTNQTRIYAVDAAYGNLGGDRCVGGWIEFGKDVDGKLVMACHPPVIIPVSVKLQRIAEDQIAEYVKNDCESLGIPPENVFFDATGRGSLGTSFARLWSPMVNPVEFGGKPTTRPVSNDLYTYDPVLRRQRLKRCDEEYRKFVTELWFSVKYIIMSGQMCNFPLEVMEEFCLREWKTVEGNRTEIETKTETKERMGRSPDLADWMVTCAEGARQRGFIISSLVNEEAEVTDYQWKRELEDQQRSLSESSQLNHGAFA